MSWQSYVDTNLLGTGHVSQAAIYGLNGGEWAKSAGFQLQPSEVQKVIAAFSDVKEFREHGIHINNVKYLLLRGDDRSIYGKKGNEGVCIVKTVQAFLVGMYNEPIQPGNCTKTVEGLADYLISVGY